jgi:thiamine-phosphate diphosphorylase
VDDARLYFVVEASASDRLLDAALAGGCDVLQLRDHDAPDDELLAAGDRFRNACDSHGAAFVVNDRPELALQCGADGVHVGQDDLPVDAVRRLVGPDMIIGLSTHSPASTTSAMPPRTRPSRGSRSAGSTVRTSTRSSPPEPSAWWSCARFATPTIHVLSPLR